MRFLSGRGEEMKFIPKQIDFELSPYTGLTRESWLEACNYLLTGIFKHITDIKSPVILPRHENEITYPHDNSSAIIKELEIKSEIFEGLTRTFFIASPVINETPDKLINNIKIRDYYSMQVLKSCTPGDPNYVGHYSYLQSITNSHGSFRAFQQTVETCALVICLEQTETQIWEKYSSEEREQIAIFLSEFGHGNTVPQNWRLFNMLVLAFLYKHGYEIDKDVMRDHAQNILNYYAGDGWYRDGQSFDYYSAWAFNLYTPIWNRWYGYNNEPYLASEFENNGNRLIKTYPDFFDRDGFTNMWGRSGIYRNASTSPLAANFLFKNPEMNPGLARRVASGSLMQFFERDDFLKNGIPTMGFYGEFKPLIQEYSCTESTYWLAKAFLCLDLPKDHPFWTEKESNGTWECLSTQEVKETVLDGPALAFTNHEASGETILRTGKVVKQMDDLPGMWNYSKLCYNTKYPWESAPNSLVESQQYVIEDLTSKEIERANMTCWCGSKDDILYRRLFFNYEMNRETTWMQVINLADFNIPYGILRVDKLRLYKRPVSITLGSYGFPDNETQIFHYQENNAKAVVLIGFDSMGREKQLAMTIYDGWDDIDLIHSRGTNPDSQNSVIIFAKSEKKKHYGYEPYVMISQTISKNDHKPFNMDELFPIETVTYNDREKCGGYGPVEIRLKSGKTKTITYEGVEGKLQL